MDQVTLEPIEAHTDSDTRWMVVIHNNDVTPFADVIDVLVAATGCTVEEAHIEAWEAHTYGRASVHFAERSDCEAIAEIIATIGVATEVLPEWS